MAKVVVTVGKDGKTKIEVDGVVGPGCTDVTKAITDSMKAKVLETDLKDAYYKVEVEQEREVY